MTAEQKNALEAAAAREGHGLSRYVETLLQRGLSTERLLHETLGPPHVRAFATLVSLLSRAIERNTGAKWHENAYVAAALAAGIRKLLSDLGMSDEMKVPDKLRRAWADAQSGAWIEDPRALGEWEALNMLETLRSSPADVETPELPDLGLTREGKIVDMRAEYRFWAQLARDLNIPGKAKYD
jgi:hypothetical protein